MTRVLSSPWTVAAVVALVYAVVVAQLLDRREGDVSRFVIAGGPGVDPSRVPPGLTVMPSGYDGAIFYRLALDPFTREQTAFGITLDNPSYRQQRIGYPLLVWLFSGGGQPRAVPWALVGVNVAALGAIGLCGSIIAILCGRHAWWGLLAAAYPGYLLSLSRDLSEIVAAACVLGATAAVLAGRERTAALLLTYAVLTRETVILLPLSIALLWLVRRRGSLLIWLLPLTAFVLMQALLWAQWGTMPVLAGNPGTAPPFSEWWRFTVEASPRRIHLQRLYFNEAMLWLVLVVSGAVAAVRGNARFAWKLAWVAQLTLAAVLPRVMWGEDFGFMRIFTDLFVLTAVVVLAGGRVVRWVTLAVTVLVWVHVAQHTLQLG